MRALLPKPAVFLALAGLLAACSPREAEVRQIIILDVDTLRASHLGSYGYERDTSPVIDEFARGAHRFEWAFSQAPNTPPSQTSILTGLYPSTHGMIFDDDRVDPKITTLAEVLRDQGFTTAAFVDGGYMNAEFGIDQGFDLYDNSHKTGVAQIGPKVFKWLEGHRDESFLLLIHTYDVHSPYDPPEPYRSFFLEGLAPPSPGFEPTSEELEKIRTSRDEEGGPRMLPEHDLEYARALYDGGIRYLDDWVRRFFEHLEALGIYDEALIVLISDHGEEFQEHGSVLHEKLYATVTHVPLVIRLPEQDEGSVLPQVVETIDLAPTLLEWAGAPIPPETQGRSLLPLLSGKGEAPYVAFGESPFFGERRFVTLDDYRLLMTRQSGEVELYAFRTDPDEQADLAPSRPELTQRLRGAIENWQTMIDASRSFSAEGGPLPPDVIEQLRALGYVE